MKVSIARTELLDALSIASKGLSSRTTLPILSGILFSAQADELRLNSTDLEISIKTSSKARVDEAGSAVIPGKLITDIVRNLPESAVTIETNPTGATVSCAQSSFVVRTLSADDFPKFPDVVPGEMVSLPTGVFSEVVHQVSRAVSRDETRPILTGVLVVVEEGNLRMVATDSYRLCVREVPVEGVFGSLEAVVPGRAIEDVARLGSSSETVKIGVSENQVVFSFGDTTFISRRIEGSFPNHKQLVPKEFVTRLTVGRQEFLEAVKRVSLMAQHSAPLRLKVTTTDRILTISAQTQDVGEATEDLEVDIQGEDVEIAFNHAYLTDGISVADGDKIALEIVSPLKPGVMKHPEGEDFIYLLMPVRLG
jgi:DNA polymerase-3 subunit beta